jgi:hypothetical protein
MHDTFYLVLRWEAWLGLFIISALLTIAALFLLSHQKPGWRPIKRRLLAACAAPLLIFVGVGIAVGSLVRAPDESWADLARAAIFTAAMQLAVVSLFVGLVTAWIVDVLTQDRGSAR